MTNSYTKKKNKKDTYINCYLDKNEVLKNKIPNRKIGKLHINARFITYNNF